MTSERRIEGPRNRLIAEWDPDTGEMTRCEFVDAEDDGTKAVSEDRTDRPTEKTEPILWPPIESPGDQMRRLGGTGMQGAHVWGD